MFNSLVAGHDESGLVEVDMPVMSVHDDTSVDPVLPGSPGGHCELTHLPLEHILQLVRNIVGNNHKEEVLPQSPHHGS